MNREYLASFNDIENKSKFYDVVILGTGIAGLFTALSLDAELKVLLITKDRMEVNNTNLAQGGIAVTLSDTSLQKHKQDTIIAGNHYNSGDVVEEVIACGSKFIDNLLEFGVNFDKDPDGKLLLTREGGHTERRILHSKDSTGQEVVRALSEEIGSRSNISVIENTFAIDIITKDKIAIGISIVDGSHTQLIYGKNIVIATGGIGRLYEKTTNEVICTGDGMAMASRAGAVLKDMEFVQFHPTALNIDGERNFLISEAVRGEGGILRNAKGIAFMEGYHELKDLAPRNIASLAIHEQMQESNGSGVYLDITHLDHEYVQQRFPMIFNFCLDKGININNDFIPVTPVQHYMMGGIVTNSYGETTVDNLYACGEVANTGMHGANRMASNSLLEGLAFAGIIAERINSKPRVEQVTIKSIVKDDGELCTNDVDMLITDEIRIQLRKIMSSNVGMIRNTRDLQKALIMLKKIEKSFSECIMAIDQQKSSFDQQKSYFETRNMIRVAKLIVIGALNRPFSLGGHEVNREIINDI